VTEIVFDTIRESSERIPPRIENEFPGSTLMCGCAVVPFRSSSCPFVPAIVRSAGLLSAVIVGRFLEVARSCSASLVSAAFFNASALSALITTALLASWTFCSSGTTAAPRRPPRARSSRCCGAGRTRRRGRWPASARRVVMVFRCASASVMTWSRLPRLVRPASVKAEKSWGAFFSESRKASRLAS
jgi:hypothetical protein